MGSRIPASQAAPVPIDPQPPSPWSSPTIVEAVLAGIPQIQSIPVQAAFSVAEIDTILTDLLLPVNTPLSVLAVELFNLESQVIPPPAEGGGPALKVSAAAASSGTSTAVATARAAVAAIPDPLGDELGTRRILRVSPLTPLAPVC